MSLSFSDPSRPALHRQSLLVGGLTLLLLVIGNTHLAAIGFDSRFVLFAQEMLRHGPSFFPTTYGEPYPDYSATSTYFIYLLSLPFGEVTSFTAWLPTALAGAALATLMYRLLAGWSQTWALLSVAWMLLSVTFITEARAVSLDLMLAAVAFAVFYLGYACDHFGAARRTPALLLLLLLGFAIRGPIGLVIPTGMLSVYYLLSGQYKRLLGFGFAALALLLAGIGLLLWLADLSGGPAFVQDVVRMQVTGRIDGSEGASGGLYYFTSSLGNYAMAYPLALLVLAGVAATWRQQRGPLLYLLGACAAAGLLVMVGLSIPLAKKARYLLPMLPMAAIVAAYPFTQPAGRVFAVLRGLSQGIWLLLPGLLLIALLLGQKRMPQDLNVPPSVLLALGVLQAAALGLLLRPKARVLGLAGCAVAAVWVAYILVVEPTERRVFDTRTLSQATLQRAEAASATLVLHGMGKDAKAIKFMVNVDTDLKPLFTSTAEQLQAVKGPAYALMSAADYAKLQGTPIGALQPVLSGKFDKDDYVLLRLAQQ
ncbi:glycosyltransferase [Pseudomonas sp. HR96]|uniref:ArnT family glycosyltransferase n=1 Tax=Pseudomonas sp. HR96 TaxID=1027966 RepID=UPI002A74C203|nr:glycosyltransferase [Pseudomonas sp. HR96]WPP01177.1 glycosyltransferase [Pseudomonas sp. HR96]